jgi:hypothetical protein
MAKFIGLENTSNIFPEIFADKKTPDDRDYKWEVTLNSEKEVQEWYIKTRTDLPTKYLDMVDEKKIKAMMEKDGLLVKNVWLRHITKHIIEPDINLYLVFSRVEGK